MIYTERKVTVSNNSSSQSAPIIIYRGDREIEILFTIVDSKYKFSSEKGNYIIDTGARYAQLAIDNPNGVDIFTDVTECIDGAVIFKITADMIDEINEVGSYSYHIRLYDDTKNSRITIPPVRYGIEIREPIVIESMIDEDETDDSTVDSNEESFIGEDGKLTIEWERGDIISSVKLNQMVEVINNAVDEEQQRKTNETIRVSNEQKRQKDTTDRLNAMDAKIDSVEPYIDTLVGNVISNDLVGYEDVSGSNFSEATFDGFMKDIEVHGNTVKNIVTKTSNNTIVNAAVEVNIPIDDSKVYTIIGDFTFTTPGTSAAFLVCSSDQVLNNPSNGDELYLYCYNYSTVMEEIWLAGTGGSSIHRVIKYQPKPGIRYIHIRSGSNTSATSTGILHDNLMILEGDYTQNPPEFFEGLKSVGDKIDDRELYKIDILRHGKNLNKSQEFGRGINEDGSFNTTGQNNVTDYCRVKENTTYNTSINGVSRTANQFFYDYNKNFIKKSASPTAEFVTPANTCYVRCTYGFAYEGELQLEEGSEPTPYQPYQEDRLTILSPVKLDKVGDVADRIICKDGVWGVEKNVKDFIIPEGNNYSTYTGAVGDTLISLSIGGIPNDIHAIVGSYDGSALSDKYVVNRGNAVSAIENVGIYLRPDLGLLYVKDLKSKYPTHSELRSSLSSSLVKYPTTQPQFIPLPLDQQLKLRTFAGKTYFDVQTAIPGTLVGKVPTSVHASVGTQSEQIDNLYDELDKVKKLEESTALTVTTESRFTTVEATSNGYFDDVKIEGKTLVNLVKNLNDMFRGYEYDNQTKVLQTQTSGVDDTVWTQVPSLFDVTYGKEYTFICNALDADIMLQIRTALDKDIIGRSLDVGMNAFKFNAEGTDFRFKFYDQKRKSQKRLSHLILLEGDHTQNPPEFFEGLKSIGQDEGVTIVTTNAPMFFGKGGRK